ncbi:MAG: nucleotidyltransferase domain-containing protein, partial [Nitrososphaera sp.]
MEISDIRNLTFHKDVNDILATLVDELLKILGSQLVGLYLTGSLTYGDFDPGSSDIDFLAILNRELSDGQRLRIQRMHSTIADQYPKWSKRIEGSYITRDMLSSTGPPRKPRPYINAGEFWHPDPRYGNEWLVNLSALRETGVALVGPDPKAIILPVDIDAVREASKEDLHAEWLPKLRDPSPFHKLGYESSHLQAYAILTMCRILYRDKNDGVASKRIASEWVKRTYGKAW